SPSSHGNEFKDELAKYGVKSKLKRNEQLEKFAVIKFLICILETINNPLDDIYLSGMLYSKMFGFTLEDIRLLREISEDMPLFVGLYKASDNEENINNNLGLTNEISAKCQKALEWINDEKIKIQSFKIDVYIENLINQNKVAILKEVDNDPNEREALNKFIDLSKEFVQNETDIGLNSFLEYAEKEIQTEKSEDENKAIQRDTVSIISIHSSKGLEYPICILAETTRKRSNQDEIKPFLIDKDFGIAMKLPDESGYAVTDSLYRKIFAKKCAEEAIYEEMRMLYVALTRAKDRLIITATVNSAEKELANNKINSFCHDGYDVLNHCRYIDWILSGLYKKADCKCKIEIVGADEISDYKNAEDERLPSEKDESDKNIAAELKLMIKQNNKKSTFNHIPAKVAASDLTKDYIDKIIKNQQEDIGTDDEDEAEDNIILPRFITGASEYNAADKGSALHTFMQFMNIENLITNGIDDEIEKMIGQKLISRTYAELIDRKPIIKLLKSELMKKMSETKYIKREFRFNVNLPASEYTADIRLKNELNAKNIQLTVQGVVDCVLRNPETGKLELIDYKTDSLTADEYKNKFLAHKKLKDRHENQLEVYGKICEKIFNEEIDKLYIYTTVLGELIEV
ncbi:MAG: 3'-5' exonuclease, partial [Eubacteriales bacterium]